MRRAAALVIISALTLALAGCGKDPSPPSRLPDVTLHGLNGRPDVDLGTFKGPAVVNLWASWCVPCKRELPLYAAFARTHAGTVSVLGINFQETDTSAATAMVEKSHVGYPLASDPDGRLRALGLPKLILVDADGKIAYQEYVEIKTAGELEELVAQHLGVSK